jgi:hypothetical protein
MSDCTTVETSALISAGAFASISLSAVTSPVMPALVASDDDFGSKALWRTPLSSTFFVNAQNSAPPFRECRRYDVRSSSQHPPHLDSVT